MKKIVLILILLFCSVSIVGACENTTNSTVDNNTTITIIVDENNITYPTIDEEEVRNNLTSFVDEKVVKNLTFDKRLNDTNIIVDYDNIVDDVNSTNNKLNDDNESGNVVVGDVVAGNGLFGLLMCLLLVVIISVCIYVRLK